MESIITPSPSPSPSSSTLISSSSSTKIGFCSLPHKFPSFLPTGYFSFTPISSKNTSFSLTTHAKKANKNNKFDSHSFVPKPDEATGPFPEAVLLKEKKVQEDGRVLPEFADDEEAELFEFLNLQMESDLNVDQMRHYEVVYLIHQGHKEHVDDVNSKIQDFLREKKGKVWRFSDWGMRRLAYKIKKATHAHYILMNFELPAKWINEFKSLLDQDERVIRHLVIKRDKAETWECPPPPEFHTLRADMTDEYDVDETEDDDGDQYDEDEQDLEGYEDDDGDDDVDVEDVKRRNAVRGTSNQKTSANEKGKKDPKREKVLL